MTSITPSGSAGEILQQPAAIGDDHRLGHPEAADPARERFHQGRLDDRRPHNGHPHRPPALHQRPFAERLGVGVGVGPAQGLGPGPAQFHQPVVDPALAQTLRPRGEERGARRPQFGVGLAGEALEQLGTAALGVGVGPGPPGAGHLGPPVQVHREGGVGQESLRGRPPAVAGHVGGGHRHQVGGRPGLGQHLHHPPGAEEVHLHGRVEGDVEGDGGGGVDDHVAGRQRRPPVVVEVEAVLTHVATHGGEPTGDLVVEAAPPLPAQAVEGLVADDVPPDPLGRAHPPARAHQGHHLAAGDATQEPLDDGGAQKSRRPGHGDTAARQRLGDHNGNS